MEIISSIILVVGIVVLIIGVALNYRTFIWRRIARKQSDLIKTQRSIIQNQKSTIETYKTIMADGIVGAVTKN